ncbi:putative ankyrin repeat protein RF_0381 [Octopus bimaculoides]|uniref:RING-type domain-containing protein n=1 Tax=Octopus bimaculoides TaxID=37653 RepID=A0A0L8FTC8_OCTBM|nr:putative ankyrin repeat protein RF_0381 [Octopus bimaculoides]|eukprot:XP_014787114.1 PREDICTED: putative ankyrin repeat protein RF_0381 [Octopus bimaculoides]
MEVYKITEKIKQGDIHYIKTFLKENPDKINQTNSWGLTYLMVACQQGNTDLINLLIDAGAELDMSDKGGNAALHYAVTNHQRDAVALMISRRANVNSQNFRGNSPLHRVVKEKDWKDVLEVILNTRGKYILQINLQNSNGDTPLHLACHWGHIDIIHQLLQQSYIDVNMMDNKGDTPLHLACRGGQTDIVYLLLQCNSVANVGNINGYTPLHWACRGGHTDIVHLLLQMPDPAVNVGDIKYGYTPLHWACLGGHTDIVHLLLLLSKPDVHVVDNAGNTPLHVAVLWQRYDILTLMLSQDSVKLDLKNRNKMTPLLLAVSGGHLGMIHKLISKRASINAVDGGGNNCLHLAVEKKVFHSEGEHLGILDEFCLKLSLSKKDRLSATVVASYLAYQGANFYHKNSENVTPLDLIKSLHLKEQIKAFFPPQQLPCLLCEDKEATVTFYPCEHTVICEECCSKIKRKTCPQCRQPVTSKSGFEGSQVDDQTTCTCTICMERRWNMVFECGHTACKECGERLHKCHLCRKQIERKIIIIKH